MKKVLFIFGTRPEAIKLIPVITALKRERGLRPVVCVTAQHRQMLDQALDLFGVKPDFDLKIMKPGQSLFDITARGLSRLEPVMREVDPALVVVQGDTTTSFLGALAGFYRRVPVARVEAGLRSGERYYPFPEEMNRVLADHCSEYFFAPTATAARNLAREGITKNVWITGNTVIDALKAAVKALPSREAALRRRFPFAAGARLVFVTGHRRENIGPALDNICRALAELAAKNPGVKLVYPVHLNPLVRETVVKRLGGLANVHLIRPLDYIENAWFMKNSELIITDSGGIQEEAPSLKVPLLITRDFTERPEVIKAGLGRLVGTDGKRILREAGRLLASPAARAAMTKAANPYGDGRAAGRIARLISGRILK